MHQVKYLELRAKTRIIICLVDCRQSVLDRLRRLVSAKSGWCELWKRVKKLSEKLFVELVQTVGVGEMQLVRAVEKCPDDAARDLTNRQKKPCLLRESNPNARDSRRRGRRLRHVAAFSA